MLDTCVWAANGEYRERSASRCLCAVADGMACFVRFLFRIIKGSVVKRAPFRRANKQNRNLISVESIGHSSYALGLIVRRVRAHTGEFGIFVRFSDCQSSIALSTQIQKRINYGKYEK